MSLPSLLNFKRNFSVSQYLQLRNQILHPAEPTQKAQWVISRGQCIFRHYNFAKLPKSKRPDALAIEIKRNTPFERAAFYVHWLDSNAMVWVWDAAAVAEQTAGLDLQVIQTLPETVLGPQIQEGVHCIKSVDDGVDIQIWAEGCLVASRWMATIPSESQWQQFIRGLSLHPSLATKIDRAALLAARPLNAADHKLGSHPWSGARLQLAVLKSVDYVPFLTRAGLLSVACIAAWLITTVILQRFAIGQVEDRIAEIEQGVEHVLVARDASMQLQETAATYLKIIDQTSQRALMAEVGQVLQTNRVELKEWNFKLGKLEVVVQGDKVDTLAIIKGLQQMQTVESVTLERARLANQHKFLLTLKLYHVG